MSLSMTPVALATPDKLVCALAGHACEPPAAAVLAKPSRAPLCTGAHTQRGFLPLPCFVKYKPNFAHPVTFFSCRGRSVGFGEVARFCKVSKFFGMDGSHPNLHQLGAPCLSCVASHDENQNN